MGHIYTENKQRILKDEFYLVKCPSCGNGFTVDSSGTDHFPCPSCGDTKVYVTTINLEYSARRAMVIATKRQVRASEVEVFNLVNGVTGDRIDLTDKSQFTPKSTFSLAARVRGATIDRKPLVMLAHMPPDGHIDQRLKCMHDDGQLTGKRGFMVGIAPCAVLGIISCPDAYPYSSYQNTLGLMGHWTRFHVDGDGELILAVDNPRTEFVEDQIQMYKEVIEAEAEVEYNEDGDDDVYLEQADEGPSTQF